MNDVSTQEKILLAAADLIQKRGYNAFSYKDLARVVNIKTSSIHYHYPKKEDLAVAVLQWQQELIAQELGKIEGNSSLSTEQKLQALLDMLIALTYKDEKKMCLGGTLASDMLSLPESIQHQTRLFFDSIQAWIKKIISYQKEHGKGSSDREDGTYFIQALIAQIEGGLLMSRLYGNESYLAGAKHFITRQFEAWKKIGLFFLAAHLLTAQPVYSYNASVNHVVTRKDTFMSHTLRKSVLIPLTPAENQAKALESLLASGAQLVTTCESETIVWFALHNDKGGYAIFDCFANEQGIQKHFAGKVAAALQENSSAFVTGGWQEGVLNRIQKQDILASFARKNVSASTRANVITFKAQKGKAEVLEQLLTGAAAVVQETEPGTTFWAALKIDDETFAIVDTFATAEDQAFHFSGQVARALHDHSSEMVAGGWQGVLDGVQAFTVIGASDHLS